MKSDSPSVLAVLILVTSALGCVTAKAIDPVQCTRGDFRDPVVRNDPRLQKVMNYLEQDWLADAVRCTAGDYVFLGPVDASRHQYFVLRGDRPEVIRLSDHDITVMDGYFIHANIRDRDKDGHSDTVSYSTWRYAGDRYVDAVDWNLDGQPDVRTTEAEDGSNVTEAWVDGRWQVVILKDGLRLASDPKTRLKRGEDGSFMPAEPTDTPAP